MTGSYRQSRHRSIVSIRQLGAFTGPLLEHTACSSSVASTAFIPWGDLLAPVRTTVKPVMGDEPLGDMHFQGAAGSIDLGFRLPLSLRLCASSKGQLDCQLQLFSMRVQWGRQTGLQASPAKTNHARHVSFIHNTAALLLAQVFFPEVMGRVLACLSVPGALLGGSAVLASVFSPTDSLGHSDHDPWQNATPWPSWALHHLLHTPPVISSSWLCWILSPIRVLQAVGKASEELCGPAALLVVADVVWAGVHASSHGVVEAALALMAVSMEYNQVHRNVILGKVHPGAELEQCWRDQHKKAAQKVAGYMGDLHSRPPLGDLLDLTDRVRISAGVSVEGVPLCGHVSTFCGGFRSLHVSASVQGGRSRALMSRAWHETEHCARPEDVLEDGTEAGRRRDGWSGTQLSESGYGTCEFAPDISQGPHDSGHSSGPLESEFSDCSQSCSHSTTPLCQLVVDRTGMVEDYKEQKVDQGWAPSRSPSNLHLPEKGPSTSGEVISWWDLTWLKKKKAARLSTEGLGNVKPPVDVDIGHPDEKGAIPAAGGGLAGVEAPAGLYGSQDHADSTRVLSWWEKAELAGRAIYLAVVFSPFLMLGPLLLLLSWLMMYHQGQQEQHPPVAPAGHQGRLARLGRELHDCAARMLKEGHHLVTGRDLHGATRLRHLEGRLEPVAQDPPLLGTTDNGVMLPIGVSWWHRLALQLRWLVWALLLMGCRYAGAAFIKWGQWAATRQDLFPADLCSTLSALHDRAPDHSYQHTKKAVEVAFGKPVEEVFATFSERPLASGSIAQVHLATVEVHGRQLKVAVKVRHPHVAKRIWQDFQLLKPLAAWVGQYRSLKGLSLKESVAQFSHTMTAQADLRVEAEHLKKFAANFSKLSFAVVIPRLVEGFVHEGVLVETFEEGASVANFIQNPCTFNTQVVSCGVDAYLKMLLKDNFVHTDLHPGNILVRVSGQDGQALQEPWRSGEAAGAPGSVKTQIVLLDFGLAEQLTPGVRWHFISFLNHICAGNGRAAAEHLLQWGSPQLCPNPQDLLKDMELLFLREADIFSPAGIDLDRILKAVLHLARQHEVTIDSRYAALVVGICVIVGFATSLDPKVNLMDAAAPCLLWYSLTGRVMGRMYS